MFSRQTPSRSSSPYGRGTSPGGGSSYRASSFQPSIATPSAATRRSSVAIPSSTSSSVGYSRSSTTPQARNERGTESSTAHTPILHIPRAGTPSNAHALSPSLSARYTRSSPSDRASSDTPSFSSFSSSPSSFTSRSPAPLGSARVNTLNASSTPAFRAGIVASSKTGKQEPHAAEEAHNEGRQGHGVPPFSTTPSGRPSPAPLPSRRESVRPVATTDRRRSSAILQQTREHRVECVGAYPEPVWRAISARGGAGAYAPDILAVDKRGWVRLCLDDSIFIWKQNQGSFSMTVADSVSSCGDASESFTSNQPVVTLQLPRSARGVTADRCDILLSTSAMGETRGPHVAAVSEQGLLAFWMMGAQLEGIGTVSPAPVVLRLPLDEGETVVFLRGAGAEDLLVATSFGSLWHVKRVATVLKARLVEKKGGVLATVGKILSFGLGSLGASPSVQRARQKRASARALLVVDAATCGVGYQFNDADGFNDKDADQENSLVNAQGEEGFINRSTQMEVILMTETHLCHWLVARDGNQDDDRLLSEIPLQRLVRDQVETTVLGPEKRKSSPSLLFSASPSSGTSSQLMEDDVELVDVAILQPGCLALLSASRVDRVRKKSENVSSEANRLEVRQTEDPYRKESRGQSERELKWRKIGTSHTHWCVHRVADLYVGRKPRLAEFITLDYANDDTSEGDPASSMAFKQTRGPWSSAMEEGMEDPRDPYLKRKGKGGRLVVPPSPNLTEKLYGAVAGPLLPLYVYWPHSAPPSVAGVLLTAGNDFSENGPGENSAADAVSLEEWRSRSSTAMGHECHIFGISNLHADRVLGVGAVASRGGLLLFSASSRAGVLNATARCTEERRVENLSYYTQQRQMNQSSVTVEQSSSRRWSGSAAPPGPGYPRAGHESQRADLDHATGKAGTERGGGAVTQAPRLSSPDEYLRFLRRQFSVFEECQRKAAAGNVSAFDLFGSSGSFTSLSVPSSTLSAFFEAVESLSLHIVDAKPTTGQRWADQVEDDRSSRSDGRPQDRSSDSLMSVAPQLVKYQLKEKQKRHGWLLAFLKEHPDGWWRTLDPALKRRLEEHSEKLAAAFSLANFLAQTQQRPSQSVSAGTSATSSTTLQLNAGGRLLLVAMSQAVEERGHSLESLQLAGLSVPDVFFCQVSRVEEAFTIMQRELGRLLKDPGASLSSSLKPMEALSEANLGFLALFEGARERRRCLRMLEESFSGHVGSAEGQTEPLSNQPGGSHDTIDTALGCGRDGLPVRRGRGMGSFKRGSAVELDGWLGSLELRTLLLEECQATAALLDLDQSRDSSQHKPRVGTGPQQELLRQLLALGRFALESCAGQVDRRVNIADGTYVSAGATADRERALFWRAKFMVLDPLVAAILRQDEESRGEESLDLQRSVQREHRRERAGSRRQGLSGQAWRNDRGVGRGDTDEEDDEEQLERFVGTVWSLAEEFEYFPALVVLSLRQEEGKHTGRAALELDKDAGEGIQRLVRYCNVFKGPRHVSDGRGSDGGGDGQGDSTKDDVKTEDEDPQETGNFPLFLFRWLSGEEKDPWQGYAQSKRQLSKLLTLPEELQGDLRAFLKNHSSLHTISWIHLLRCQDFNEGSLSLLEQATAESASVSKRKTLLSLGKLSLLADRETEESPEGHEPQQQMVSEAFENELLLVRAQETLAPILSSLQLQSGRRQRDLEAPMAPEGLIEASLSAMEAAETLHPAEEDPALGLSRLDLCLMALQVADAMQAIRYQQEDLENVLKSVWHRAIYVDMQRWNKLFSDHMAGISEDVLEEQMMETLFCHTIKEYVVGSKSGKYAGGAALSESLINDILETYGDALPGESAGFRRPLLAMSLHLAEHWASRELGGKDTSDEPVPMEE